MVLIHFFRLIRLLDLLFIASAFFVLKYAFINPVISTYNYESSSLPIVTALSQIEFLCMVLSSCLIAAGSFAINNYFDIKNDDLLNLDYNPVGKEIPRTVAMLTHILFSITGIVIAFYLSFSVAQIKLSLIQITMVAILWQYNVSFKKQPFIGNFMISLIVAIGLLLIPLYDLFPVIALDEVEQDLFLEIFKIIIVYAYFLFALTFTYLLIKDLNNLKKDKELQYNTTAIFLGEEKTKYLSVILICSLLAIISYIMFRFSSSLNIYIKLYAFINVYLMSLYSLYLLNKSQYQKALLVIKGIVIAIIFSFITLHYSNV